MTRRALAATAITMIGAGSVIAPPPAGATPVEAAPQTCFGRTATIVGGAGHLITGTDGSDVIVAGRGVDTVEGGGGDDWICATSGGHGLVTLDGGPGDDHLLGGSRLIGGRGNDVLRASVLAALFVPGRGQDRVVGDASLEDEVSYRGSAQPVLVDLAKGVARGQGRDSVRRVERVTGSESADILRGDDASNVLTGLHGGDELAARSGDDDVVGGSGADLLDGGSGFDSCDAGSIDQATSCEH